MNIDRFRQPSKLLVYLLIMMHALTACVGSQSKPTATGPQLASSFEEQASEVTYSGPRLDVIIPAFSPGLSEDEANYEEEGIWPELRRAEANRFAYKLKQALEDTGKFGAVRVTPDNTASGDLYVLGEIVESNGMDLEFDMEVVDISGKQWLDENIEHEVSEGFYKNPRNEGKDAYDPAFEEAANRIVAALLEQQQRRLAELKQIADLRFGASFNEQAFLPYLNTDAQPMTVTAMPSDADPLFQRVKSVRVREQLFIDNLQQDYSGFSQQMEDSYLVWQKASFTEMQLRKYDNNIGADIAAVAAGVGGAVLINSGFTSREEAKMHQDAINELGESVNLEMSPQVISFEEKTVELTGDVEEQFQQWRAFMAQMYELEATPETQL